MPILLARQPAERVTFTPRPFDIIPTANLIIRREIFEQTGRFSLAHSYIGHDTELFYRLLRAQHHVKIVPALEVTHPLPTRFTRSMMKKWIHSGEVEGALYYQFFPNTFTLDLKWLRHWTTRTRWSWTPPRGGGYLRVDTLKMVLLGSPLGGWTIAQHPWAGWLLLAACGLGWLIPWSRRRLRVIGFFAWCEACLFVGGIRYSAKARRIYF